MGPVVQLIAGSYEQIAFGYRLCTDEQEWTATADFTHHAHRASLSAVATSERFIATGSKDETIQLYDMKKRIEHGALLHHDGTISCLEFYGTSHLLSGGEDGLLCVWGTKKWDCLKSIRAHKGQVSSLSVHPSGKLALSVGTDKTLRTWNLIDGRSAFIKNIKQSKLSLHTVGLPGVNAFTGDAHIVKWSPDGDKYVVVIRNLVDIYNLETATLTGTVTNPIRISSIKFLNNSILVIAGDDETVRLCDVDTEKLLCEFKAHDTRVKAVDSFTMEDYCVLVTASNDGFIKMWKLHLDKLSEPPVLLGKVNTTARLNCLAVWKPSSLQEAAEKPTEKPTTSEVIKDTLQSSKTKRVKISAEEVILEEDNRPKKQKKDGGKKKEKT